MFFSEEVYKHKNKEYGAYMLQKMYVSHIIRGFMLSVFFVLLLWLLPLLLNNEKDDTPLTANPYGKSTGVNVKDLPNLIPKGEVKNEMLTSPATKELVAPKVVDNTHQRDSFSYSKTNADINENTDSKTTGSGGNYDVAGVQVPPSFPGGEAELQKFLKANIRYPEQSMKEKKQGEVVLGFTVNEGGSITDIKVIKKISAEVDAEAIRVMKLMPLWDAGIQNGKEVKVTARLSVYFRLPH